MLPRQGHGGEFANFIVYPRIHLNIIFRNIFLLALNAIKHYNKMLLCVYTRIYLYNSQIEGVFKVSIMLAVIKVCVIMGSKRCRTNRSRAPVLQGVIVIAETSTVLKVPRFEGMF